MVSNMFVEDKQTYIVFQKTSYTPQHSLHIIKINIKILTTYSISNETMKVTTVSQPEENCNEKFETINSQEDISYTLYIVVETC